MIHESPRMVTVELETECQADSDTVWRTLVEDIDSWWGEPYVSSPERQSLTLDSRIGGLLFEDWGNGNGTTWATVRSLRKPNRIDFEGTFMMYGAVHGTASISIEPFGQGRSQLSLVQHAIGAIDDDTVEAWNKGWNHLLASLKQQSESKKD